MNKVHNSHDDLLLSEACAWVAQIDEGLLSASDQDAFREWYSRSPAHQEMFKLALGYWGRTDSVAALAPFLESERKRRRPTGRKFGPALAGVLASCVFAVVAAVFIGFQIAGYKETMIVVASGKGEFTETSLPDGSTVYANSNSRVEVRLTRNERSVSLLEGEALFEVAPDSERPFIVYAGEKAVRAVGTAFSVDRSSASIEVSVLEGVVELYAVAEQGVESALTASWDEVLAERTAVLIAGQQASSFSDENDVIRTVPLAQLEQRAAWRGGVLDFSGERLDYVVAELEQHLDKTFVIDDEALKQVQVAGIFQLKDADRVVQAISANLNIKAIERKDGSVLLTRDERVSPEKK